MRERKLIITATHTNMILPDGNQSRKNNYSRREISLNPTTPGRHTHLTNVSPAVAEGTRNANILLASRKQTYLRGRLRMNVIGHAQLSSGIGITRIPLDPTPNIAPRIFPIIVHHPAVNLGYTRRCYSTAFFSSFRSECAHVI